MRQFSRRRGQIARVHALRAALVGEAVVQQLRRRGVDGPEGSVRRHPRPLAVAQTLRHDADESDAAIRFLNAPLTNSEV